MTAVEVPGPEPGWERAPQHQGEKKNPALQRSMWEYAGSFFRPVAGLSPSLEVLLRALGIGREALTFRGDIETGFIDLRSTPEA